MNGCQGTAGKAVMLDDATGKHPSSMCSCNGKAPRRAFTSWARRLALTACSVALYTDLGSHHFDTHEARGKVDRSNPTQFGRALAQLRIEHIAAYSPGLPRAGKLPRYQAASTPGAKL